MPDQTMAEIVILGDYTTLLLYIMNVCEQPAHIYQKDYQVNDTI